MTVVFERPYQFVAPIRNTTWPWIIQRLRLYDYFLSRKEGVVDYELRGLEHIRPSLEAKDGILLAPNHCRYADPLVMGWPARELGVHVHAIASWHLFNKNWLDSFGIRRMGGFSIFREGNDRQSLETAIDILVDGKRPLIIFPEGTTNRTNDELKPLLDGVAFIARTAAKRRAKLAADPAQSATVGSGKVVIHPVGIKYLCIDKIDDWANRQVSAFERQLGWRRLPSSDLLSRTLRLAEAQLALKEVQYMGHSCDGDLPTRRDNLIEHLLTTTEQAMTLDKPSDETRDRVRQIRSAASNQFFDGTNKPSPSVQCELRSHVQAADLAQDLSSYPDDYLNPEQVTDTRIVETIQRMQEQINGKADHSIRLKAVIEFAPAIPVGTKRPPKGQRDPLMQTLEEQLLTMLARLSGEARKL